MIGCFHIRNATHRFLAVPHLRDVYCLESGKWWIGWISWIGILWYEHFYDFLLINLDLIIWLSVIHVTSIGNYNVINRIFT